MNKEKLFRRLGKFAAVVLIFMWINQLYIWFARNGFISLIDSGALYTWAYVLMYSLVYAVPIVPLVYFCFNSNPKN